MTFAIYKINLNLTLTFGAMMHVVCSSMLQDVYKIVKKCKITWKHYLKKHWQEEETMMRTSSTKEMSTKSSVKMMTQESVCLIFTFLWQSVT